MKNSYLIVVDMQNDFVNGSLGTEEAQQITFNVLKKVANYPGHVILPRTPTGKPIWIPRKERISL